MESKNGLPPNRFDSDPRRKQELAMRPAADRLYNQVFGVTNQGIVRMDSQPGERHLLDREHGIDVQLVTASGLILTGQEKFLSAEFAKYNSLTVEFEQNQHTGEKGDWYKLACQFYFVGYASVDLKCFTSWVVVDWPAMVLATRRNQIKWRDNKNKNGKAKASFKFVSFDDIPPGCIIWRGKQQSSDAKLMLMPKPDILVPTFDQVLRIANRMNEGERLKLAHSIIGGILQKTGTEG